MSGAGKRGNTSAVLAAGVALAAVAWSWRTVRRGDDPEALDALAVALRGPHGRGLDAVLSVATDVGSVFGILGTAGALAVAGDRSAALDVAGAGAIGWCVGQGAKPLAARERPWQQGAADLLVHPPTGTSWPSGHAAVSAAVATALAPRGARTAATGWVLAAMVGATRVHVGAHHPTDVIAGWGVGVLSGLAWRLLARRG